MANREKNLKKINEALEKLDDEQLEQIAGGWAFDPRELDPSGPPWTIKKYHSENQFQPVGANYNPK